MSYLQWMCFNKFVACNVHIDIRIVAKCWSVRQGFVESLVIGWYYSDSDFVLVVLINHSFDRH